MPHPLSKVRWLALAPLALACGVANALGLGQIQVKSAPGEPLRAEIPIIISDPDEMIELRASLADPDTFRRIGLEPPTGLVADLRFRIVPNSQGLPMIEVSTSSPVEDPSLTFLVELNWAQGRMVREFSALVDTPNTVASVGPMIEDPQAAPSNLIVREPEVVQPEAVQPQYGQEGIAIEPELEDQAWEERSVQLQDDPVEPVEQFKPQSETANTSPPTNRAQAPRVLNPGDSMGTIQRGQTLSELARPLVGNGRSLNQAMVALLQANPEVFIKGNINMIKAGAILRVPQEQHWSSQEVAQAGRVVAEHVAQWRKWQAPQDPVPTPEGSKTEATEQASQNDQARLEIVPNKGEGQGTNSGKSSDGQGDVIDQARAQEEQINSDLEIQELRERLDELEGILRAQEKLIELKNEQLMAAQQALEKRQQQEKGFTLHLPTLGIVAGVLAILAGIVAIVRRRDSKRKQQSVSFLREDKPN